MKRFRRDLIRIFVIEFIGGSDLLSLVPISSGHETFSGCTAIGKISKLWDTVEDKEKSILQRFFNLRRWINETKNSIFRIFERFFQEFRNSFHTLAHLFEKLIKEFFKNFIHKYFVSMNRMNLFLYSLFY